jgi:hypothetical protein
MKVFISHAVTDQTLADAVCHDLALRGHAPIGFLNAMQRGEDTDDVTQMIHSADALVAIISGNPPNVLFELGIATGAGKPTLIASSRSEALPFELSNVPFVLLTGVVTEDAWNVSERVRKLVVVPKPKEVSPEFSSAEKALRSALEHPSMLAAMSHGAFEELVAKLFVEREFKFQGPKDKQLLAADFELELSSGRHALVEVKKLSAQSQVSIRAVHQLASAVSVSRAECGLLISTTTFTPAAITLAGVTNVQLRTLAELLEAKSVDELLGQKSPRVEAIVAPLADAGMPDISHEVG